jgi:hypothetical protein
MTIENIILFLYGAGLLIALILLIIVLVKRFKEKDQENFEKRDF